MSLDWLKGSVSIVTGASQGIGRGAAEAIAKTGSHAFLAARSRDRLEEVSADINSSGGKATSVVCDVSEESEVKDLFQRAGQAGPVRALVVAAGTVEKHLIEDLGLGTWEDVLKVNLTGAFLCCKEAMGAMKRAGGGRIITLGSLSGIYAVEKFPGLAAYNVSKYGLVGLTEAVAVEGRPHGVSAICVSPGAVNTEMLRKANPDLKAGLGPEEMGKIIVALLDDALKGASGANIPLFSNL